MTDNEIKKALECCLGDSCYTSECSFFEETKDGEHCQRVAIKYALDLINRLQADNENLKDILYDAEGVNLVNYWHQQCKIVENGCRNFEEENKKLQAENEKLTIRLRKAEHQLDDSMIMYNTIKSEAYKEFANEFGNMLWQMKTEYLQQGDTEYASALVIIHTKLAKFLKELVGE